MVSTGNELRRFLVLAVVWQWYDQKCFFHGNLVQRGNLTATAETVKLSPNAPTRPVACILETGPVTNLTGNQTEPEPGTTIPGKFGHMCEGLTIYTCLIMFVRFETLRSICSQKEVMIRKPWGNGVERWNLWDHPAAALEMETEPGQKQGQGAGTGINPYRWVEVTNYYN
jgi:hypothetical protein